MENQNVTSEDFRLEWHEQTETSVKVSMTVIAQMVNSIDFDPTTECWNFNRKSAMKDTPALSFAGGHTIALDVLTMMFETDEPAPAGAYVLRSCGNPQCLAPYHLTWSTTESGDGGTNGDAAERTLHARAGAAVRYCEGVRH